MPLFEIVYPYRESLCLQLVEASTVFPVYFLATS